MVGHFFSSICKKKNCSFENGSIIDKKEQSTLVNLFFASVGELATWLIRKGEHVMSHSWATPSGDFAMDAVLKSVNAFFMTNASA